MAEGSDFKKWGDFQDFMLRIRTAPRPSTYRTRISEALKDENYPPDLIHISTRGPKSSPPQIYGKVIAEYLPETTGHSTFILKEESHPKVPVPDEKWNGLKEQFLNVGLKYITPFDIMRKLFDFTHSEETVRRFVNELLGPILDLNGLIDYDNQAVRGDGAGRRVPDYLLVDKNNLRFHGVVEAKGAGCIVKESITQCMQQLLDLHAEEKPRNESGPLFGVVTDALHFIFIKLHSDGRFEFEMDTLGQLKVHTANTWQDLRDISAMINGLCQLPERENMLDYAYEDVRRLKDITQTGDPKLKAIILETVSRLENLKLEGEGQQDQGNQLVLRENAHAQGTGEQSVLQENMPAEEAEEPTALKNVPVEGAGRLPASQENVAVEGAEGPPALQKNVPVEGAEGPPVLQENMPVEGAEGPPALQENMPLEGAEGPPVLQENMPAEEAEEPTALKNVPVEGAGRLPASQENVAVEGAEGPPALQENVPVEGAEGPPVSQENVPVEGAGRLPASQENVAVEGAEGPPALQENVPVEEAEGPPVSQENVPVEGAEGPQVLQENVPVEGAEGPPVSQENQGADEQQQAATPSNPDLWFSPGDDINIDAAIPTEYKTPRKTNNGFLCPVVGCNVTKVSKITLFSHIRKEHTGLLQCRECPEAKYSSADGLNRHMKKKHNQ